MWYVIHKDELYHHGILGQKWGKRNGPPYPLGADDHSAREKKAGWRKSLDNSAGDSYNNKRIENNKSDSSRHGLSDGQKRALKIGVAAAAAGLAAYGGYKLYQSGKLDPVISRFAKNGEALAGDLNSADNVVPFANKQPVRSALKRLSDPETLSQTIQNVNPNLGNPKYDNNCTYCGIAAILRRRGYDVTAKDSGGKMQNTLSVVEKCFRGAKTLEGSAVKFGRSPEDAAEMLIKHFGQNAEGVAGISWDVVPNKDGIRPGHTFNWLIENGRVSFYDAQNKLSDSQVRGFWQRIDKQGHLALARLDNAEINYETIGSIVE